VAATLGVVGEGLVELGLEPAPDSSVVLGFGGDAANTAVMAARLGSEARIAGRVGADSLGARLLAFWREAGVDVSSVLVDPEAPTGIYVNERGSEGPHRFDYHRRGSAGSRLQQGDLSEEFFAGLDGLHLTGVTFAVSPSSAAAAFDAIERARARDAIVSLAVNHRPALGGDPEQLRRASTLADVVFASEDDLEVIGMPQADEVVLTRGAGGAAVRIDGTETAVAGIAANPFVDDTGAGDALAGAYLARRLAGDPPQRALRTGVAAASLSCGGRGCALSYPEQGEVEALLRR
jgi:2-dehydro-3-deoxygluconokinase